MAPVTLLPELISLVSGCVTLAQKEKTRRASIRACRDMLVAAIESETSLLSTFVEGEFQKRDLVNKVLFSLLDAAIQQDYPAESTAGILHAITILAYDDPVQKAVSSCLKTG